MSNVGNPFWGWILKDCMEVQEKKKKVVLCSQYILHKTWNSSHAVMAKRWTKSWKHVQNCSFANLILLLFWPFSLLSPSLSPLLLICSHFMLFAFSLFHSPLLSSPFPLLVSVKGAFACLSLHWAHGSVAQIASHAWEHLLGLLAYGQMPPTLKKIWGKRLDVCVAPTLIVFHRCLSPWHSFQGRGHLYAGFLI